MSRFNLNPEPQFTEANSELSALRARVAELEANEARYIEQLQEQNNRLATLEAPPVVPVGYEVTNGFCARWNLWSPTADRPVVLDSPAALRALAWAIEHDQRPPHASDGKEGGEHG